MPWALLTEDRGRAQMVGPAAIHSGLWLKGEPVVNDPTGHLKSRCCS